MRSNILSVRSKGSTLGLGIISVVGATSIPVNEGGHPHVCVCVCVCMICCSRISVKSSAGDLRMGKEEIDK